MSKSDRRLSLSSSANFFFFFFLLVSYTVLLSSAKLLAVSYGFLFCFFSVIVDQQFFFLGIILILGKFNVEIDETLKKYETYFAYASHGSLGCRLHMKNILDFEKYSHLLFNSSSI